MKHTATLLLLAALATPAARAQTSPPTTSSSATKGPGRITGRVLDAATQKPVEYATIALLPATGTTPLLGGSCDEQGRFELKDVPTGSFRLQISFVGNTWR